MNLQGVGNEIDPDKMGPVELKLKAYKTLRTIDMMVNYPREISCWVPTDLPPAIERFRACTTLLNLASSARGYSGFMVTFKKNNDPIVKKSRTKRSRSRDKRSDDKSPTSSGDESD